MTDAIISSPVLSCEALCKVYRQGPQELVVLKALNFQVAAGERVAVIGQSGSGKSTLLNLLGGLDLPSSGEVFVDGSRLGDMDERQRGQMRNRQLGFVYQFHHLMMEFTAQENVAMPLLIRGESASVAAAAAQRMLAAVGLEQRCAHKPAQLSGGERQRVAIARALVSGPQCVLMDEPTGNLDRNTAANVQQQMMALNRELGTSFVVVTHDPGLARSMDRVLELRDGSLHAT